jgi:hypothetical protein
LYHAKTDIDINHPSSLPGLSDLMVFKAILDDPKALRSHSVGEFLLVNCNVVVRILYLLVERFCLFHLLLPAENTLHYHRFLNLAPQQLKIAGPSVAFLHEMMRASDDLFKVSDGVFNICCLLLNF